MRTTKRNNRASGGDGFFSANSKWLMPLSGTLMVITSTFIVNTLGGELGIGWTIPEWLMILGILAGAFSTGFGAMITDTIAAMITDTIAAMVLRKTIVALVVGAVLAGGIMAVIHAIRG